MPVKKPCSPPKRCHVFLQEIQDRIRIIELYAKDRQFADFVRQHQAWVALFASYLYSAGRRRRGPNKPGWEEKGKCFGDKGVWQEWTEGKKTQKQNRFICLVGGDERCQSSVETDLSLWSPPPARPRGDTVWLKLLWDTHIPLACQLSGSVCLRSVFHRERVSARQSLDKFG